MKKLSTLLLSSGLLMFAACGEVKIDAEPIGEVDFTEAKDAFFALTSTVADADLDGTADDQVSTLLVVLANDPELCTKLEADPNALDAEADARLVTATTVKIDIDGTASFVAGDILTTTDAVDANGAPIDNSAFILSFAQKVNGADATSAIIGSADTDTITINQIDAEAGDLELEISAALTDQVVAGVASEINVPVSIRVKRATKCDAILGEL
jgi:hypothetical protein